MIDWQPISTAPKDRPILVWHDHESDPYHEPEPSTRLTIYGAHCEGLYCSLAPGAFQAVWGGEYDYGDGYIPNWWFKDDGNWESPLAPTHWAELKAPSDG